MLKFDKNKKYTTIAIYAFVVLSALCVLVAILLNFSFFWEKFTLVLDMLSPFIYGFVFAYLCNPILKFFNSKVYKFIEKKKKHPKLKYALSIITTYIVVAVAITIIFLLLIPQVVKSYTTLQSQISSYVTATQTWADDFVRTFPFFNGEYQNFAEFLDVNEITSSIKDFITNSSNLFQLIANYIISYAGRFVLEMKNILLGVILSVYFLLSKDKIKAQIKKTLSAFLDGKKINQLMSFVKFTDDTFGGYIVGNLLDSLMVGLLTFIILAIFEIPYYPLISVIVGVTNLIPFFGPFMGAIPSAFIILIADPIKSLFFIIIILIIQQIDGNIITPKILGDSTGLSAMWVIIAITISGDLFGIAGMFLGVPVFAVVYAVTKQQIEKRLKNRKLPQDTGYYYINKLPEKEETGTDPVLDSGDTD